MAAAVAKKEEPSSPFVRSEREFFDPTLHFQVQHLGRSDTPNTMLTDYPNRPAPDISVQCQSCKQFVSLSSLKEHRLFHSHLATLRYISDEPKSVDLLLKRRNAVLRKIKSSATAEQPVTPQQIQKVNDAYEYVKSILEGNYETHRQVQEDVNADCGSVSLNCSPDCVYAVGIATSGNERWKSHMEDARTFQDSFGEDKKKCYFGLFDGFHGRFAAEIAASELHKLLLNEMMKFDPSTKSIDKGSTLGETDLSSYRFERPNTNQSERVLLYNDSIAIIQNIINVCESKYNELISERESISDDCTNEGDDTHRKKKKKDRTPFEIKMEQAFCKAYYLLDILLSYGKDENSKIRWSGCSAATCVIQDVDLEDKDQGTSPEGNQSLLESEEHSGQEGKTSTDTENSQNFDPPKQVGTIHLANAGNTHAVLVRGNRAYTLTKDHTPTNKKERNRVLKEGGTLSESSRECRVNGVLLTTRGLGNHGDKILKKCVIVEPYTTSVPVDQYAQFLILATRGVWEVFTDSEAASLLIKLLPSNQIPPPSKMSSSLKPLFDKLPSDRSSIEPNSQRISYSSRESPFRPKSSEQDGARSGTQRSSALHAVKEQEDAAGTEQVKGEGPSLPGSDNGVKGQNGSDKEESGNGEEEKKDVDVHGASDHPSRSSSRQELGKEDIIGAEGLRVGSAAKSEGHASIHSIDHNEREIIHSTPTPESESRKSSSKKSSSKKSKKYTDADMQTEVGSQQGDEYSEDSGNEGDIDTYLDNVSFSGSISRISMIDGPPSRESVQRHQAQYMAEHLVQAALLAGAKDNISVMIVLLPGSGL